MDIKEIDISMGEFSAKTRIRERRVGLIKVVCNPANSLGTIFYVTRKELDELGVMIRKTILEINALAGEDG